MNILAVDDEPLMLWQLTENLKRIFEKPEYRVSGFDEVDDVMEWLDAQEKGSIAYAFLDIKLRGMSGIELAKDIRERSPETKVIFCTAYSDYAMEAFSVHAVGYLLKPVSEGDIRDVLRQLDKLQATEVYVHAPEPEEMGLAVYNRLLRAAAFRVVHL